MRAGYNLGRPGRPEGRSGQNGRPPALSSRKGKSMATDLRKTKPASPGKYESFVEEQLARAQKRIRPLDAVSAGLVFLAGTLGFLFLMVWLDKAFGLPEAFRQIALAAYGLGAAAYLGVALVLP